jgi:cytidylate kinase
MSDDIHLNPIDYDDLKRRISEAIGKTFRELAAERGMSFDEFREYFFAKLRRESRSKAKRKAGTHNVKRKRKIG